MEFTKQNRKFSLKVSDVVFLEVAAITGTDREAVATLSNFKNVIHRPVHTLANSKHCISDEGLLWDCSDTHGLYSKFSWSGP